MCSQTLLKLRDTNLQFLERVKKLQSVVNAKQNALDQKTQQQGVIKSAAEQNLECK